MNEMGKACGMYGGEERCMQSFDGKPDGNRPLGRPGHRWEDNIKLDLRVTGWVRGSMDWIELVQDRDRWQTVVNTAMKFWVP
jgi:hypothetical protein